MSAEERTTSSTGGQKGVKLERFDLIPIGPLTELARHYGVGARKYANHQWRQGYEWSKSYAALQRHLTLFWAGQDYDVCSNDPAGCQHYDAEGNSFVPVEPDTCFNHTGSHHMAAVAWHAFLLLEFKNVHPEHDDRYKPPAPEPEPVDVKWFIPHATVMPFTDLGRDAMWAVPDGETKFGTTFSDETMTLHLEVTDVNTDLIRLLAGLPVEPTYEVTISGEVSPTETEIARETAAALQRYHNRS